MVRTVRGVTYVALFSVWAFAAPAADKESSPRIDELVRAGQRTVEKLRVTSASWRVRYRMPNGFMMETKVVRDKDRLAWSLGHVVNGRSEVVTRVIESGGVWHVIEGERRVKYKPYEAELHLPGAYLLLSLAQPVCVSDDTQLASAKFEGRRGNVVSFRLPLPPETRRVLEKSVAGLEQLTTQDPTYAGKPETARTLELMREQLSKGTPLGVDEATGIQVEWKLQDMLLSIEDFQWLSKASDSVFAMPKNAVWDDQTRRWSGDELNDCILAGHDPSYPAGGKSPNIDAYLINVRTGKLRRLPYRGIMSSAGCFLTGRREVIVSGGPVGLVKLDLETGVNTLVESDLARGRISTLAELSPDGKSVATMQMSSSGQMLDLQIRVVNLKDGRSRLLGRPEPIGGPFSWLPDGDGLILKRYERSKDIRAIEPRILCRMDLDGKLTDLRSGDWPVVLRKSRRILFKDDKSDLWHTCELDGTKPELFANGLAKHAMPAVSPDEMKVIFARYEPGKLPELLLFELGKAEGRPFVKAKGFTGTPVWR